MPAQESAPVGLQGRQLQESRLEPPSFLDMQGIVTVEVVSEGAFRASAEASRSVYYVHKDFLVYHADRIRPLLKGLGPQECSSIEIKFETPSVFRHFLVYIYKQKIFEGELSTVHHGEWINLWLLAETVGSPKLQNEIIMLLEEYRTRGLFKSLSAAFLRNIYDTTPVGSSIRRYVVDTWNNSVQTADARDYPPGLLIELVDAQRLKAQHHRGHIFNPRAYFVANGTGSGMLLPSAPVSATNSVAVPPLNETSNIGSKKRKDVEVPHANEPAQKKKRKSSDNKDLSDKPDVKNPSKRRKKLIVKQEKIENEDAASLPKSSVVTRSQSHIPPPRTNPHNGPSAIDKVPKSQPAEARYCYQWVNTGNCSRVPCPSRHELPEDYSTVRYLGLHGPPKWYKRLQNDGK